MGPEQHLTELIINGEKFDVNDGDISISKETRTIGRDGCVEMVRGDLTVEIEGDIEGFPK